MQVEKIGRTLNLTKEVDRIEFVLTLARAFFLAKVMVSSAPQLRRRPTLYSTIHRGSHGSETDRYTESSTGALRARAATFNLRGLCKWLLHLMHLLWRVSLTAENSQTSISAPLCVQIPGSAAQQHS